MRLGLTEGPEIVLVEVDAPDETTLELDEPPDADGASLETEGEAEEGDESLLGEITAEGEEPGEPEAEPPEESGEDAQDAPVVSALEVETLVEERLKEFEERFQAEKEEAYRAGFEDGRADGLKDGQEQSRDEIDRFQSILEDLTTQWNERTSGGPQSPGCAEDGTGPPDSGT